MFHSFDWLMIDNSVGFKYNSPLNTNVCLTQYQLYKRGNPFNFQVWVDIDSILNIEEILSRYWGNSLGYKPLHFIIFSGFCPEKFLCGIVHVIKQQLNESLDLLILFTFVQSLFTFLWPTATYWESDRSEQPTKPPDTEDVVTTQPSGSTDESRNRSGCSGSFLTRRERVQHLAQQMNDSSVLNKILCNK